MSCAVSRKALLFHKRSSSKLEGEKKKKKEKENKKAFIIMKEAHPIWRNEGLFEEALKTEFQ